MSGDAANYSSLANSGSLCLLSWSGAKVAPIGCSVTPKFNRIANIAATYFNPFALVDADGFPNGLVFFKDLYGDFLAQNSDGSCRHGAAPIISPVFRLGWEDNSLSSPEIARMGMKRRAPIGHLRSPERGIRIGPRSDEHAFQGRRVWTDFDQLLPSHTGKTANLLSLDQFLFL